MGLTQDIREFDFNLIKVLDAVISEGSAARASRRLKVTPAAVSQALSRLQSRYQETLFIRSRDGLVPTHKAREIHHAYRQIIELMAQTLSTESRQQTAVEITLLGTDFSEQYYLSRLAAAGQLERLQLTHISRRGIGYREVLTSLHNGSVDLAIMAERPDDSRLTSRLLERFDQFCVVCHPDHPLAGQESLTLAGYYSLPHAVFHKDLFSPAFSDSHRVLVSNYPYAGSRKVGYRGDSVAGLLGMVENSDMIAILPTPMVNYFMRYSPSNLVQVKLPPELDVLPLNLYSVWSRDNLKIPALSALANGLEALQQPAGMGS